MYIYGRSMVLLNLRKFEFNAQLQKKKKKGGGKYLEPLEKQ